MAKDKQRKKKKQAETVVYMYGVREVEEMTAGHMTCNDSGQHHQKNTTCDAMPPPPDGGEQQESEGFEVGHMPDNMTYRLQIAHLEAIIAQKDRLIELMHDRVSLFQKRLNEAQQDHRIDEAQQDHRIDEAQQDHRIDEAQQDHRIDEAQQDHRIDEAQQDHRIDEAQQEAEGFEVGHMPDNMDENQQDHRSLELERSIYALELRQQEDHRQQEDLVRRISSLELRETQLDDHRTMEQRITALESLLQLVNGHAMHVHSLVKASDQEVKARLEQVWTTIDQVFNRHRPAYM